MYFVDHYHFKRFFSGSDMLRILALTKNSFNKTSHLPKVVITHFRRRKLKRLLKKRSNNEETVYLLDFVF